MQTMYLTMRQYNIKTPTSYRMSAPKDLWEYHFELNGVGSWISTWVPSTEHLLFSITSKYFCKLTDQRNYKRCQLNYRTDIDCLTCNDWMIILTTSNCDAVSKMYHVHLWNVFVTNPYSCRGMFSLITFQEKHGPQHVFPLRVTTFLTLYLQKAREIS